MNTESLLKIWKDEESRAHITGWDFSYIEGRYTQAPLPWDYKEIIRQYLMDDMLLLDQDTGGGEFLLSLRHPYSKTYATEGYPPNVSLCEKTLPPLGITFRFSDDAARIPFPDESFDMIINRHGSFCAREINRLLKKGGLFINQQVGEDNERDLVDLVLPGTEKPFPGLNLKTQKKAFEDAGFEIIEEDEAFPPIRFFDMGAFVWFAHIIEWEFPMFSVDRCFDRLLKMQKTIEKDGYIEGTCHRYLIAARKA